MFRDSQNVAQGVADGYRRLRTSGLPPVLESAHTVPLVVTQPDKTGRGHHQHVNVVKQLAEEFSVPVLQPPKVNQPEVLEQLRQADADVFLVASFGQILRPELLAIPRLGAFNLHGSLLPKYRGTAPSSTPFGKVMR
ncbi:MAG UNVERIFIED_CONTAM: hypothetical protein LVR18_28570 [Planctomycetaceae bacterium]